MCNLGWKTQSVQWKQELKMGGIDIKWCENKLCSNKDSWKNSPFCNTEEKWWHIWSHTEFMKTEIFLQRVKTYFWCPFPATNASISQQVDFGNWREQWETAVTLTRVLVRVPSPCSHQKFLKASLFFHIVSACGELCWNTFSWHVAFHLGALSPKKSLAHLFLKNLVSESDFSWKF